MARKRARRPEQPPERNAPSLIKKCAIALAILSVLVALSLTLDRFINGARPERLGPPSTLTQSSGGAPTSRQSPPVYTFEVVNKFPHDEQAFCQGLDFDGDTLFESTGKYGQSSIRRVDLETGRVEKSLRLDASLFGEGLTLFKDRVFQITWKSRLGYIFDAKTLKLLGTFRYDGEGWGLTHNDKHLILSDGTDRLRFLDPVSFSLVKSIRVRDGKRPVRELNELEFVDGQIYANIWHSDRIAMIDPSTGDVTGWIDLAGLPTKPLGPEAVLNGIAYERGRLFVTGKNWPELFEIKVRKK